MILLDILALDTSEMCLVPMHADESGDEEFVAEFFGVVVGADVGDSVVQEEGISCWAVDCSVEDVGDYFSL